MLKLSNYNICIDKNKDGILLYNSVSGAFCKIYSDLWNFLQSHTEIDEDIDYGEPFSLYKENLRNNGFLVNNNLDEKQFIELKENMLRFSSSGLGLTIAPTLACNFDCPYCYEQKQGHRMSEEVQNNLVQFVEERIKHIDLLNVSWYGGEPLLEFDIICSLSEKFIEICTLNDVQYSAGMVTNGYFLTKKNAEILVDKCQVRGVQVTMDGCGETHNARRRLRNGGDSFSQIVKNIDDCKDIINISIRVNVDKTNMEDAEELISFYHEKGWDNCEHLSMYFACVRDMENKCNTCLGNKEFDELATNLNMKMVEVCGIESIRGTYPISHPLLCSALSVNSFVVDPDGNLCKCWEEIGREEFYIGTINRILHDNPVNLKWLSLTKPEKCSHCRMLPVCVSGCPLPRMRGENTVTCDFDSGYERFCSNLKMFYQYVIEQRKKIEMN